MKQSILQAFYDWIEDGNVSKFDHGYSTQDSQWTNSFKTKYELYKYFVKEFFT